MWRVRSCAAHREREDCEDGVAQQPQLLGLSLALAEGAIGSVQQLELQQAAPAASVAAEGAEAGGAPPPHSPGGCVFEFWACGAPNSAF